MAKRKHDEDAAEPAGAEESYIALDTEESSPKKSKKDSKEQKDRVNTTVFVSSLPYETTTTDLVTHFSFIGPVKNGFVVKDRASGQSKGVGYITFTLKEDAEKAVEDLNNGPFGGASRKIRVELAGDKPSRLMRSQAVEPQTRTKPIQPGLKSINTSSSDPSSSSAPQAGPSSSIGPGDKNAIRTVILMGIPSDVDKNTLWKKVRKYDGVDGGKDGFVFPVEGGALGGDEQEKMGLTAHILFNTHAKALEAVAKLHAHTYKGHLLSCVLKKRVDNTSASKASSSSSSSNNNRAGRLIVRNLAWNVTESDLRYLFLPFGPILGINLPTMPSTKKAEEGKPEPQARARGFAFVWFLAKADAERAIERLNGKEIKERKMAVDFALSKEKWEEAKKGDEEEKKDGEEGDVDMDKTVDGEEAPEDGFEEEAEDGEEDAVEEQVEEKPIKPTLPAPEEGSTLFIRNLPFEVTEEELRNLFRAFGPLRYAKITMDHSTGRSRGTGFACFWKTEDADKVLAEAARVEEVTGANSISIAPRNPFALPSILTVDPSANSAASLVIHGRTLDVVRALTREDAAMKKEDGERARVKGDKRNTYLMREGVIFPNTPASRTLPEVEVEKRVSSFKARRQLLEANPSLYISKTRLSVRQLPLFATDRTLKRLAIHAVREFDSEVEAKDREDLAREEKNDETLSPALQARKDKGGKGKKERETVVIQSKINRQVDRVDPLTNLGKSKGYGFLEIRSHREALKILRWANNNPEVGALMKAWYAEELSDLEKRMKEKLDEARKSESKDLEDMELKFKKMQMKVRDGVNGLVDGTRQGKTLLIEFSVENVQVVKRRVEKVFTPRDGGAAGGKRKRDDEAAAAAVDDSDDDAPAAPKHIDARNTFDPKNPDKDKFRGPKSDRKGKGRGDRSEKRDGEGKEERPAKRPRGGAREGKKGGEAKEGAEEKDKTFGKSFGGVIGRKRKERKMGGKK